ncbi:FAD/NAD(P)-binding protein [Dokdonella sp.]|uniref:FAD/NAD(P)-binding protein n=1 Tax=Dokdonella sp. TaxID=2291710 RepID=UPI0025BAE6DB|nr:FAD/NAD(P)-binding protein [Dokdonella sp.]MBX3692845.1 FAD/NAD(P)-binding protein [Dokdonella sp.]
MKHVAVIGGGAAAAAVVGEILRHPRGDQVAVHWFAGHGLRGRGIAYATPADHHVLNVRAAAMGLFADDGGAFFRDVVAHVPSAKPTDFLPRAWFGDYVERTLAGLIEEARGRNQTVDIRQTVAVAMCEGTQGLVIEAEDGSRTRIDEAVLALGALPPSALPEVTPRALDGGNVVVDAWQPALRAKTPRRIVVIGTGLTAVDVILDAVRDWPDAHITAVSRHGHLPGAHLAEPGAPYEHQAELIDDLFAEPRVARWTRALRRAAREDGADWRAVVDGLRPVTVALWQALPETERRRFLRHLRSYWEISRHRLPTPTADFIEQLRQQGRLDIVAARIERVDGDNLLAVDIVERASGRRRRLDADLVVQATGPRLDASATRDPLVRQLLADGLVRADTVGLGLACDNDGRLRNAGGERSGRLHVLGALMRGSVWECAAFAEIRQLARSIAHGLVSDAVDAGRSTRTGGLSRTPLALVG